MFTFEEYENAIAALRQGRMQLSPDGNCCSVCEDSGHQAWECPFNPLVESYSRTGWRCFHCNKFFTDPAQAAAHFGTSTDSTTCHEREISCVAPEKLLREGEKKQ